MEFQIIEHIRHSLLIDRNRDLVIEKLLNLTLEIISLLTREDFIVVRKASDDHVTEGSATPVSDRCTPSPIVEEPIHLPTEEKVLKPAPVYHGEAEEVPGDPRDVENSFSMSDYDFSEEHKDAVMVPPQPHSSAGECSSSNLPGESETPLYSQDCIKEEIRVMTPDYQADPGHRIFYPQYKEEETPLDPVGSGEGSSRNFPERCETPQYPDCMEEETRMIPQEYQAEPVVVMVYPQCKEEDIPAPISSGCDTGTETIVEQDGGDDGGLEDFPLDPCEGPSVSYNTEVSHPWKKNQSSDLNILQIPHLDCVCGKCPVCKQGYTIQQRPSTAEKTFSECERLFEVKSALLKHQRSHAQKKSFAKVSALSNHKRSHNNSHIGTQCKQQFQDSLSLLQHVQTHRNNTPYVCGECGKSFKCHLKRHMLTHTGEKPYSCPKCTKSFSQKGILTQHLRTHTGEKPYACPECTKIFSFKSNLIQHLRTHTGEKPYSCSECTKRFSKKASLIHHLKTHSGEKINSCPECTKFFLRESDLIKHLKTHTVQSEKRGLN